MLNIESRVCNGRVYGLLLKYKDKFYIDRLNKMKAKMNFIREICLNVTAIHNVFPKIIKL